MHFQYPNFLYALLVLSIPIIIHLFNFRRYKKLYFSNVQFLKQVDEQQAAGRKLKDRLILLIRLLASFFLVMAFAKPFFSKTGSADFSGRQVVSIFVDNSNSMQALGSEGILLDEAKSRAKQIAKGYSRNTRYQLLTQDFFGKDQRFVDQAEFENEVDGITFSSQSRTIDDIFNRQQSLLQNMSNNERLSYLISDFQLGMLNGKTLENKNIRINLVQLQANDLANIAIDSVWLQGAVHRPGEVEKLIFKLHNYANKKAANVSLKLFINNKQKGLGSYSIAAGSGNTDTISFSGLQAGWQHAELRLQDNPITFDNVFYFSFNVAAQMPVLLIGNNVPNKYIKAAFDSEPFFKVTNTPFGSINYSTLSNYPLIVMSDLKGISAGLAQQLRSYVQKGGSLVVFPSAEIDINSYQPFLQSVSTAIYGKKKNDTVNVDNINLNAGVYKNTFEHMPQNPDLPKVTAFYPLIGGPFAAERLMTLANNNAFWTVNKFKSGKVYICAVPVDESFSNLPRHSLFVTTLLRIGLISGSEQGLYSTIGITAPIAIKNSNTGKDETLKLTDGKMQIIPDVRNNDGATTIYVSDQVTKAGTYNLMKKDSLLGLLSFNNKRSESDMHYYTKAALKGLVNSNLTVIDAGRGLPANKNADLGFQLWKLCLLLVLIFLGAEILLVRFSKTSKAFTS